jgi:hypothetical protein
MMDDWWPILVFSCLETFNVVMMGLVWLFLLSSGSWPAVVEWPFQDHTATRFNNKPATMRGGWLSINIPYCQWLDERRKFKQVPKEGWDGGPFAAFGLRKNKKNKKKVPGAGKGYHVSGGEMEPLFLLLEKE